MIPKIIHYVWLSSDSYPYQIKECMDSWHRHMPDWEYRLWDLEAVSGIDSIYMREAIAERKWACAADFIRLYAIYHYGGVYLDGDVLVYQSLASLLNDKMFIGRENSIHIDGKKTENYLTSHCFGAEKGNEYIAKCLSYYDNHPFVTSKYANLPISLRYDNKILPFVQSEIAKGYGYNASALVDNEHRVEALAIYPRRFFDAIKVCSDTYCKHLALGSWREGKRFEETYSLRYKIVWRVRWVVEKILRYFDYVMIKLR